MDNIFIVVIFITLSFLIFILLREIRKQKKAKPKHKLDKSLEKQLLTMLSGDKKAALRLLRYARQKNPGQTYLWYHEKAMQRGLEGFLLRATASRSN